MTSHTHDHDALVFACPACAEQVAADQLAAEIAEAPVRHVTVYVSLGDEPEDLLQYSVELPFPMHLERAVVVDHYRFPGHPVVERGLDRCLTSKLKGDELAHAFAFAEIINLVPGALVDKPKADPMEGQPTLFG